MTRILILAAVIGLLGALVVLGPAPRSSPYASALSALAGTEALAAPSSCGNTGCNSIGHCSKQKGTNCRYAAGECQQTAC